MEVVSQLEKARELIEENKAKQALKLLKPLYLSDKDNPDVMLEVASAFESLEQWDKAKEVYKRLVKRAPENSEHWLRLSYIFSEEDKTETALRVIDKGLEANNSDPALIIQKAHLLVELNQIKQMHQLFDEASKQRPECRVEFLIERASIYEGVALTPKAGAETIQDSFGMTYAVRPLKLTIADLTAAIKLSPSQWQVYLKRAHTFKQLQEFESAESDFDRAILLVGKSQNIPSDERSELVAYIEELKNGCQNNGRGEREAFAKNLKDSLASPLESPLGAISQEEHMANTLVEAMTQQFVAGESLESIINDIVDDPDEMTALSIAQEIIANASEPNADIQPVNIEDFTSSAQKYCRNTQSELRRFNYRCLGDFEPRGLTQRLGQRVLMKLFLSKNGLSCGAAFQMKPLKPSFVAWLFSLITRKWKKLNIIELESELENGQFVVTNNSGETNPFETSEQIEMMALPLTAPITEVIVKHHARLDKLKKEGFSFKKMDSIEDVKAAQERMRIIKNDFRQKIGFVRDNELRQLLGKQYDHLSVKVNKYIAKLSAI
ncbi:lipopolysaccharide assembly protein LapB [Aliikangiella sp. G2MR2-5]|uniref:tetratricopeptide repeat protein n=1 Tax=Aliikangiella sp. G2MR2-5 TaxID=2788943 RepID=UPI0018AC098C|nr:tetratricopeptide repeat protein [Aliikangiella sp. G2MR2-5]